MTSPGQPFITGDVARSYDEIPVSYDWHDFLLNVRTPGAGVALNYAVRPPRNAATGYQWVVVTPGRCGFKNTIFWPIGLGMIFHDGTAVWASALVDDTSLRTTISTLTIDCDSPVSFVDLGIVDLIETILVTGGASGSQYDIRCDIICANGEKKQAVLVLPVQD